LKLPRAFPLLLTLAFGALGAAPVPLLPPPPAPPPNFVALRAAIADLAATHGARYPDGDRHLAALAALEADATLTAAERRQRFTQLQRTALLANPALDFDRVLVVRRRWGDQKNPLATPAMNALGLPSNHECNSSLARTGYDNELAVLSLRAAREPAAGPRLTPLHRPPDGGYVGEIDLHPAADRLLFTQANATNWSIFERRIDGSGLRQVSAMPDDVDAFDASYLPNGRIVFGSTACFQSVPCWHGQRRVTNLYQMEADGTGVRQLCFDQDHDLHPVVLPNGQVMYHRWDYTGINHIYLRMLMVMNPDGTGQRAVYGSSSWFPNAIYFPQPLPGSSSRLIGIVSGYHGPHRMGQLVVFDTGRGWQEADGMVQRISGRGDPIRPQVADNLVVNDWPKFLHPAPITDKHFLVAAWPAPNRPWGIYLADVFDNLVLIHEEPGQALLEPVPVRARPTAPVIPDRIDPARTDATVYLHDVYAGPGLAGVPRGTVKALRIAAYHFGYPGLAGPDLIGRGGPWEVMRILGTTPVEADGSAHFRVPAGTPLTVQPLDAEGKAVQLMRSWFTAMPGEHVSCIGCHDRPADAPAAGGLAATRPAFDLAEWLGPPRGFDFAREVQPVLDANCVQCHHGAADIPLDLRAAPEIASYRGLPVSKLAVQRQHPDAPFPEGKTRYTPAYDALLPYVRRVGIEDDVSLQVPGEYHADTSPLVQLLRRGHGGVRLDAEAWSRIITWIDLNAPCHGGWSGVNPIPDDVNARRLELRRRYGGPAEDLEKPRPMPTPTVARVSPAPTRPPAAPPASPPPRLIAAAFQSVEQRLALGAGVEVRLVRIPAGEFSMGDAAGRENEHPVARVTIPRDFWMGACEITNAQFRRFNPAYSPHYYGKRHVVEDDRGIPLDAPDQPAVRVSWQDAMAFCAWLSRTTGRRVTLPTEAQWEWACRAGTTTPFAFGALGTDFSAAANLADLSFAVGPQPGGKQVTGGLEHLMLDGADLSDRRWNDGMIVTAPVGRLQPNAWGLHDLHGNAAEWTLSAPFPYPYRDDDGRNATATAGRRVVRGGSFYDPPARSRSSARVDYPAWQRVFNVGFRIVVEEPAAAAVAVVR
jgi:formylglycine-generating enzyme required for sulfatase activity